MQSYQPSVLTNVILQIDFCRSGLTISRKNSSIEIDSSDNNDILEKRIKTKKVKTSFKVVYGQACNHSKVTYKCEKCTICNVVECNFLTF